MECNKDEAYRAKGIAERKFAEKDYQGAWKLAVKAQRLYPKLDGILHLLASLNVQRVNNIPNKSRIEAATFWTVCCSCKEGIEYSLIYRNWNLHCPTCRKIFQAVETVVPLKSSEYGPAIACSAAHSEGQQQAKPTDVRLLSPMKQSEKRQKSDDEISQAGVDHQPLRSSAREAEQRPDYRMAMIRIGLLKAREGVDRWRVANEAAPAPVITTKEAASVTEVDSVSVPDADFHDFDKERSQMEVRESDLWLVYDENDGMPRLYSFIRRVVSLDPFSVEMSWLVSKSSREFGTSVDWIGQGFRKSCGNFNIGKNILKSNSPSIFSDRVKLIKGRGGIAKVYPAKGDVWALYKNWSADWFCETPKEVRDVYEAVEVLDNYSEEQGVSVIPLVKVAVFCRADLEQVKRIRKEEMFRFSHQMRCHLLTGKEAPNAPAGFLELDPASLSEDMLKVV